MRALFLVLSGVGYAAAGVVLTAGLWIVIEGVVHAVDAWLERAVARAPESAPLYARMQAQRSRHARGVSRTHTVTADAALDRQRQAHAECDQEAA